MLWTPTPCWKTAAASTSSSPTSGCPAPSTAWFAHVVAEEHPEIPIIIISGVSQPDDREVPPGSTFIAKPFKASLLVEEAKLLLAKTG